ncbi:MAG: hypothetical protein E6K27_14710 [Gammaproteobacteria bacterium]|nr:MAG: hypothetical protein E6K27_14710 [Gammaproteobacteria bacterium]
MPNGTVSTPALEVTRDRGLSAATLDLRPEGPTKGRMVSAGAVSISLHALLLLTVGLLSFESRTPGSAPELRLYIESIDSGDADRERAGAVERLAAPVAKPREEVLASRAGTRSPVIESSSEAVTPAVPPKPDETRDVSIPSAGDSAPDPGPSSGSDQSDSPAVEGAVVTTVGPSEREEPVPAEAAKPPQPGVPIGEAQESVLAHWILKAAQSLQEANQTHARLSLEHKGRRYSAFLERRPAADEMGIDRLRVEISTEQNGKRLLTLLELKRLAFSHFTQLVDDWDQEDLLHGDVIVGRFHSNSVVRLRLDRIAPQVLGKLTTAASQVDLENGGPRALRRIFRGGIETNTPRISLPADFRSFVEDHADRSKMRTFERSARVTFYSDGSYGSRELGSTTAEERQTMSAPHYIVAGRGATLAVHGTVKGAVVVYSPERIVIEGNVVYAHDPRSDAGAEDYLGLISAPPNVTGPGDLEIQGAIYAKRRFIVSDDSVPGGPTTCPCGGTLSIHGSLTAGSLSPTEPRYATRYEFDERFERVRPPGFPVTNRYEVDTWDPEWREAEDDRPAEAAEGVRLSSQ